jgi:hypothetical protein
MRQGRDSHRLCPPSQLRPLPGFTIAPWTHSSLQAAISVRA